MMERVKILFVCGGLLAAQGVVAQKQAVSDSVLNRTVVVENQYNPEVMDAFKINVLPNMEEPAVAKQEIDYATAPHLLQRWNSDPMAPMLPEFVQGKAPRGYVRAAYGNLGNIDLKGSYLWNISDKDQLGVMASMYGRNGNLSRTGALDNWNSRFYKTDASLDYRHDFRNVSLKMGGAFASQVFNYMPSEETLPGNAEATDRQHFMIGEGYVGLASHGKELPVEFAVQTGFRSFDRKYDALAMGSGSEKIIHTQGYMAGAINPEQQVGIGLCMDNVMYDASLFMKDYTLLQINPYYALKNDRLALRIGAHVDWQTANGSGVKWAPDVMLDYTFASSYTLFLHLTGGTELNDFRRLNHVSPYWMQYGQLLTSYTPLDVRLGLKASPLAGFGFKLQGGYRITENDLFVLPGLEDGSPFGYAGLVQEKAKVAYAGMSFSYAYLDWIDFTLSGNYYAWDVPEEMDGLLLLKPQFDLDFAARGKVVDNLHVTLDYHYEGRNEVAGVKKADAVNNLCVGAEYELFKRMNVFVRLNNLLDKNYLTAYGYPQQGFYFMAGLSCRF